MSKIQKLDLNLGQKIVNPFKTQRTSMTNPFKYSNFEGNTLQFADVFEGFEPKKVNKLKMITASVMGSMTKIGSVFEPITKFVNRVRGGIVSAWDYAKNTNISDIKGIKEFNEIMRMDVADIGKGISGSISESLSGIKTNLSYRLSSINSNVTELGSEISSRWSALIGRIHHSRISKDTTVDELRAMWEAEIASAKEAA